jgi:hypothetical protein
MTSLDLGGHSAHLGHYFRTPAFISWRARCDVLAGLESYCLCVLCSTFIPLYSMPGIFLGIWGTSGW